MSALVQEIPRRNCQEKRDEYLAAGVGELLGHRPLRPMPDRPSPPQLRPSQQVVRDWSV